MSVLGIDIGNDNCVVAAVKERGIDILLNDESKRETPGVVSFGKQRFHGSTAAACATMNPKSTISQLKRLIGRSYDQLGDDKKLFPFDMSKGLDDGIQIHLKYMGKDHIFAPVELLAMLMKHLKRIAEKDLAAPVSNCVIGVPSYFTDLQRRLYFKAAEIAGLNPLRLMHDCTATALGYGIYKTDFPKSGPTYVVFVDMGHSDTQVAVVEFTPGRMKVLSHASDSNLGARNFDDVLFRYFAEQFQEQFKIDVTLNARACIRLRVACEKLKKVLSANPEAPLHIECLIDDIDVQGLITRDVFEERSSSILDRIVVPCQKALIDAGVKLEQIHSVELVGSGSRIPAVTRNLVSIFHQEPRRTLNASECVARGCALQCAMMSPVHRVKEYKVEDSLPFGIEICFLDGPSIRRPLFQKKHAILSAEDPTLHKSFTFEVEAVFVDHKINNNEVEDSLPFNIEISFLDDHSKQKLSFFKWDANNAIPSAKVFTKGNTFKVEAFYADHNEPASQRISTYEIGPFPDPNTGSTIVMVNARLTVDGILTLTLGSIVRGDTKHKTQNTKHRRSSSDSAHTVSSSSADYANNTKRKGMKDLSLQITESVQGAMTQADLLKAKKKELQLSEQDKTVEQTKENKNTLESYVYETRNKISSTYKGFATEAEELQLLEKLQQTENWLYQGGDDESAIAYNDKLQELIRLVDPIKKLYIEEETTAQAVKDLHASIVKYQENAGSLSAGEKVAFRDECIRAEQWLLEKTHEQESLPKNVDRVLLLTDIQNVEYQLDERYKYFNSRRKSKDHAHWEYQQRQLQQQQQKSEDHARWEYQQQLLHQQQQQQKQKSEDHAHWEYQQRQLQQQKQKSEDHAHWEYQQQQPLHQQQQKQKSEDHAHWEYQRQQLQQDKQQQKQKQQQKMLGAHGDESTLEKKGKTNDVDYQQQQEMPGAHGDESKQENKGKTNDVDYQQQQEMPDAPRGKTKQENKGKTDDMIVD